MLIKENDKSSYKECRIGQQQRENRITELYRFCKSTEGGVYRVTFSDGDLRALQYFIGLMWDAGMNARIDTAGNIIARRK
jgi:hypothetical protein